MLANPIPAVEQRVGERAGLSSSRLAAVPWVAAAVLLIALAGVWFLYFREKPPAMPMLRYTVAAPEGSIVHSFAVSPDGRYVVIAAAVNEKRQLWLRPLDALQEQPMPFTEDATYPFWSPDSRYQRRSVPIAVRCPRWPRRILEPRRRDRVLS